MYSNCEFQFHSTHRDDARLECDECLKKILKKTPLKRHQIIHLKTKRFEFTACKTTFHRKYNLKKSQSVQTFTCKRLSMPSLLETICC